MGHVVLPFLTAQEQSRRTATQEKRPTCARAGHSDLGRRCTAKAVVCWRRVVFAALRVRCPGVAQKDLRPVARRIDSRARPLFCTRVPKEASARREVRSSTGYREEGFAPPLRLYVREKSSDVR